MSGGQRKKKTAKAVKPRLKKKNGEGGDWQFRFSKTEETAAIERIVHVKSREELEESFGLRIDEDLEWGYSMRDIVKNILVTIGRGSLKPRVHERKGGSVNENKKDNLSSNDRSVPR